MALSELEKQQIAVEERKKKAAEVVEKLNKAVRSIYASEDGYFVIKTLVRASGLHKSTESMYPLDREKRKDVQVIQDFVKSYILAGLERKQIAELLGDVFTPDED